MQQPTRVFIGPDAVREMDEDDKQYDMPATRWEPAPLSFNNGGSSSGQQSDSTPNQAAPGPENGEEEVRGEPGDHHMEVDPATDSLEMDHLEAVEYIDYDVVDPQSPAASAPAMPTPGPSHLRGKKVRPPALTLTARGKFSRDRDRSNLKKHFQDVVEGMSDQVADILAKVCNNNKVSYRKNKTNKLLLQVSHAGIANNTSKTHSSIKKSVLRLFPERPDFFMATQYGDQLEMVGRMLKADYKPQTVAKYLSAYTSIVADEGGKHQAAPPEMMRIKKGLRNLDHNPAKKVLEGRNRAYSVESLSFVSQRAVDLLLKNRKWTEYQAALFKATILTMFFGRLRSCEALTHHCGQADVYNSLLDSDVIFVRDNHNKITHVHLWLRNAKFQEKSGALVVIPKLDKGNPNCPVRALRKYAKLRQKVVKTKTPMPFFMTEHLWVAGSSRPNTDVPGFYTKARFSKDVNTAVKELVKYHPRLHSVYEWLVTHSLRAGLPTALMEFKNVPKELQVIN